MKELASHIRARLVKRYSTVFMLAVAISLCSASALAQQRRPSVNTSPYESLIQSAASRYRLDLYIFRALVQTESAHKPGAVSPKGASGLAQLMPATAKRFGVQNIFDPAQNIEGGARYLRWLLDYFGGDYTLALAGYNAGEGAVLKYGRRVPPFRETQDYVVKIQRTAMRYRASSAYPVPTLAVARAASPVAVDGGSVRPRVDGESHGLKPSPQPKVETSSRYFF